MIKQISKERGFRKIILWIALAHFVMVVVTVFGISAYAAYSMTQLERVPIEKNPADYSLQYEDISFSIRDGLTLKGWWIEAGEDQRVIVIVHGSEGNRAKPPEKMLGIAKELISHGYNILMFDMRGHGESEAKHVSAGLDGVIGFSLEQQHP